MAYNIGINVVEVDGSAPAAIPSAAVSVGAFNITTKRGLPNQPVRITSFTQFEQQFGGYLPNSQGAYLVKGFFDNGGQTAYINRVVSSDPASGTIAASITLQDGANPAQDTLTLESGSLGQLDPGAWGNDLYIKIDDPTVLDATLLNKYRIAESAPATIQGSPLTEPIDMATPGFPSLSVFVDGEATPTQLTFRASDFTNASQATRIQIRDAINRQTNKLIASISTDNRLVLTSTGAVAKLRKDWSSLRIAATNATLGFTAATTPTLGTPVTPTTTGIQLVNVQDLKVGDALHIFDSSATPPVHTAFVKVLNINPVTGAVQWSPPIADIATYTILQTRIAKAEFNLTIAYGGHDTTNIVETWQGLSMEPDVSNYVQTVLNDSIRGSHYVTPVDKRSASGVGLRTPKAVDFTQPPTQGRDGVPSANDFIGNPAAHTGFDAFDAFDVQLVTCERTDTAIVSAALTYCANRGDCVYIGGVPPGYVGTPLAVHYGQTFQGKKVYGALYGPLIKVFDPIGSGPTPVRWIYPVGHVMGVYARIANSRGIWKAPAGDEANLQGALDVEYRLSDAEHKAFTTCGHCHRCITHTRHRHTLALCQRATVIQLRGK